MAWLKDYYATGKRGTLDGVPIWRPKWWGALGNDREFREATRETYNKAHYPEGTIRVVRNGIPYRFAAHVKGWKKGNRDALCQGSDRFGLTLVERTKHGQPKGYGWGTGQLWKHYGLKIWDLSYDKRRIAQEENRFEFPPDLFVWARRNAKAQRGKARQH